MYGCSFWLGFGVLAARSSLIFSMHAWRDAPKPSASLPPEPDPDPDPELEPELDPELDPDPDPDPDPELDPDPDPDPDPDAEPDPDPDAEPLLDPGCDVPPESFVAPPPSPAVSPPDPPPDRPQPWGSAVPVHPIAVAARPTTLTNTTSPGDTLRMTTAPLALPRTRRRHGGLRRSPQQSRNDMKRRL